MNKIKLPISGKTYHLYVADNDEVRNRGLSGLRSIPYNTGMIFVYPDSAPRSFTMRDTHFPLNIIFLDENYNVIEVRKGTPRQNEKITCKKPAKYVIEIPG